VNIKKLAAFGLAAGVIATGVFVASPANAEPVSNGYVVVGSDTLQDSMNALTNGTSVTNAPVRVLANGTPVGNFDAFPTTGAGSMVQTKPSTILFPRPSGSGGGLTALRASTSGNPLTVNSKQYNITGLVDISRSSSAPKSADISNEGKYAYIPYGRDAVAYAYKGDASLASLTTAQLTQIYSSATPVTLPSGVTVSAVLPQSGSGTRNFFLEAIGVSTVGASVSQPTGLAENDASVLTGSNQIIPFSAANWVAQSNNVAPNTIGTSGVQLGSPNGVAPVTGSGTSLVPNATFYDAAPYGRNTFLITEFARIDPNDAKYDANLAKLLDPTDPTSLTGWRATGSPLAGQPAAVKIRFGFLKPANATTVIRVFSTL
jgi:hypothetical protein